MNTPTLESTRRERVAAERALLLMSLDHARRHALDMALVATDPERAKLHATLAMLDVLATEWAVSR